MRLEEIDGSERMGQAHPVGVVDEPGMLGARVELSGCGIERGSPAAQIAPTPGIVIRKTRATPESSASRTSITDFYT